MTTKIHLSCDGRGLIQKLVLTGGQEAVVKMALDLVQGKKTKKVIADRAYDTDWLLHYLNSEGVEVVIPSKSSQIQK